MAKVTRGHWVTEAGTGVARRDRRSCDYEAYVPDPLTGRRLVFDGGTAADIADAERAIAILDTQASALSDTQTLARILLRAECVASARIEGLEAGARALLRAEAAIGSGEQRDDIRDPLITVNSAAALIGRTFAPANEAIKKLTDARANHREQDSS